MPDIHNTVLFGMIHIKYHPLVRFQPTRLLRFSADKNLAAVLILREEDCDVEYDCALLVFECLQTAHVFWDQSGRPAFHRRHSMYVPIYSAGTDRLAHVSLNVIGDHPTKRNGLGLNHGFLDEVVVTSFGVVSRLLRVLLTSLLTTFIPQHDYGSAYIEYVICL